MAYRLIDSFDVKVYTTTAIEFRVPIWSEANGLSKSNAILWCLSSSASLVDVVGRQGSRQDRFRLDFTGQ